MVTKFSQVVARMNYSVVINNGVFGTAEGVPATVTVRDRGNTFTRKITLNVILLVLTLILGFLLSVAHNGKCLHA